MLGEACIHPFTQQLLSC